MPPLPNEVALGQHRIVRRIIVHHRQKVIERTQRRQPSIDGGNGVTGLLAMFNVAVNVTERDL